MIIFPPKGLLGSSQIQSVLEYFFEKNPSLKTLPKSLHVRGHPSVIKPHIIIGPISKAGSIAHFIQGRCNYGVTIGPIQGVDGDGLKNWVSFSRDLRSADPKTVARICLLSLLQIHDLITW